MKRLLSGVKRGTLKVDKRFQNRCYELLREMGSVSRNHKFRTGCSWLFSVICLYTLLAYGFCISSVIIFLLGIMALPIKPIQKLWRKVPVAKGWFKPVCLGVIFFFSVCGLPQKGLDQADNTTVATNGYSRIEKEVTIIVTKGPSKAPTEEPTVSPTKKPAKKAAKKSTKKRTKKPTPTEKVMEQPNESIIGNKNTKAYHRLSCSRLPNEENRVYFNSEAEANAAGYDNPCDYCNP